MLATVKSNIFSLILQLELGRPFFAKRIFIYKFIYFVAKISLSALPIAAFSRSSIIAAGYPISFFKRDISGRK
jgi:hypothetical protein